MNRQHAKLVWVRAGLFVLAAGVTYWLVGLSFPLGVAEKAGFVVVVAGLLTVASLRGVYSWAVAMLGLPSLFVSLTCSFGERYTAGSPVSVDVVLGPWAILGVSSCLAVLLVAWYERRPRRDRFPATLLILFAVDWVILSLNVADFHDWLLENALTVPFALLVAITHGWFRLSNLSYAMIFGYMLLHIVGTHYTYSEVPFGNWLQGVFELSRNHYDRIVHFAFGLLIAYPMREVAVRIGAVRGFWGLYVPLEFVLAFSAIYEIIEWLIAVVFGGDVGIAYLGTQGDEWDAVKDMALAGVGACLAMGVTFSVLLALRGRAFWIEFVESFRVKQVESLGEERIAKLQEQRAAEVRRSED
ncbi:MAG: DUF2238 domain-containing protein [Planctomycetes bacterium]|nr:DUF2238 domain-containing protein [Planctomycetota bacterium]